MRKLALGLALMAVLAGPVGAAAPDPKDALKDPAEEAKARAIFQEVRCVVCQNESIDDSDAEIAADLRKIVRDQVAKGRSKAEILQFLTNRYGEFVLLKPVMSWQNALLWGAPILVLLAGGAFLYLRTRKDKNETDQELGSELSAEEEARLRQILNSAASDEAGDTPKP